MSWQAAYNRRASEASADGTDATGNGAPRSHLESFQQFIGEHRDHLRRHLTFLDPSEHVVEEDKFLGVRSVFHYRSRTLTTWAAFSVSTGSVWLRKELWMMMFRLFAVALIVALITASSLRNPAALHAFKFISISTFLNGVVGLMLGLYMSFNMHRWYQGVDGFLRLMEAISNLQVQFAGLGVPVAKSDIIIRYAFASAWILYSMLLVDTKVGRKEKAEELEKIWQECSKKTWLDESVGDLDPMFLDQERGDLAPQPLLSRNEINLLATARDPACMLFMWVSALLGRYAKDGIIPGQATPTFGRLMDLCQAGHGAIREVKATLSIQSALVYAHFMATLVHINNVLNSITLGLVTGVVMALVWQGDGKGGAAEIWNELMKDGQNFTITLLVTTVGPTVYYALLLISLDLASPIDASGAAIPVPTLLHRIEVDVIQSRKFLSLAEFPLPQPFKA